MVIQEIEYVTTEMLDGYVVQAAQAAGYEEGFGIKGCDLVRPIWWAGYCRQSLEQQSHNNRLPEYLLTLAKLAKAQGVVIPREYLFYDHVGGEHLDRPNMQYLRHKLMDPKRILGILFADLRCLSREPAPQQVFERECEIRGVKLVFGDAPSGMDIGSQFARSAITFSNKLTRLATNRNAKAGNIGRVLKGSVPSHKAAYGYTYRRDAEITSMGRIQIKKAWWEVNSIDQDGKLMPESPADIITRIFQWVGNEGRTVYWVAKKLNEMGIKGPTGGNWAQDSVRSIMLNHCYTGHHKYNAFTRVPNPERPLGDITGAVRRTLLRPNPISEAVEFSVPPLVTEGLWGKANQATRERGRGRGKDGKAIEALLRNRIFCPRCGKPLTLRRNSTNRKVYYFCSRLYHAQEVEHCPYHRFVPGIWDESVWDCVYALLKDDGWIENRLSAIGNENHDAYKLVKLEQLKIIQSQNKMAKVREGFEGGLYDMNAAKAKVNGYQDGVNKAEQEINRLQTLTGARGSKVNVEEMKKELQGLAHENMENATFAERRDIISKLGIRVYPSEDLKTMKIKCSLNAGTDAKGVPQQECRIIEFASLRSQ